MAAQLAATVYVKDPQTHQTVELAPGTSPEPRLAALVTNPAAWIDGKLPRAAKTDDGNSSSGQDDASGDDTDSKPTAKKTPARKSTATKPATSRGAADTGSSGD